MAVNGQKSCTQATKHLDAAYFLIKDHIDHGDLEVRHASTKEMWADSLNKPKQGFPFCVDRHHIMNCPIHYDDAVARANLPPKLLEFESKAKEDQPKLRKSDHRNLASALV